MWPNGPCGGLVKSEGLGALLERSNVTVGKGDEADIVVKCGVVYGRIGVALRSPPWWSELEVEPESSIVAAAEVVDTIVMAAGGRGWLWLPS